PRHRCRGQGAASCAHPRFRGARLVGPDEIQRARRARPTVRRRACRSPGSDRSLARPRRWPRRAETARRHRWMSMTASRSRLAGHMPLSPLLVLCAVAALLTGRFLSPLNVTNILVQSSIMAVIAMGMTFVIVGGGFDLSVGSTAALAGCVASMVMLEAGISAGA